MVVDGRERFAERAAKMLADLSLSLQEQGIEPYDKLAERTASYSPEFEHMVYAKLTDMNSVSSRSSR